MCCSGPAAAKVLVRRETVVRALHSVDGEREEEAVYVSRADTKRSECSLVGCKMAARLPVATMMVWMG